MPSQNSAKSQNVFILMPRCHILYKAWITATLHVKKQFWTRLTIKDSLAEPCFMALRILLSYAGETNCRLKCIFDWGEKSDRGHAEEWYLWATCICKTSTVMYNEAYKKNADAIMCQWTHYQMYEHRGQVCVVCTWRDFLPWWFTHLDLQFCVVFIASSGRPLMNYCNMLFAVQLLSSPNLVLCSLKSSQWYQPLKVPNSDTL